MLRNYIKIAFRNLWKTRLHSLIMIAGLSVGIACCILIVLFVKDEWTFDKFHSKAERIYRAWVFEDYGKDEQFFNAVTPFPLGPALKENFQEVAEYVQIHNISQEVKAGVDAYSETITIATPTFFDIFDFEVLDGRVKGVLDQQTQTIITRSIAEKLFGTVNAIGETITMNIGNGEQEYTIKAVVQDPPSNSSIRFGILISDLNNKILYSERALGSWYNVLAENYVVLKKGVSGAELETKLPSMVKQVLGERYVEGQYKIGLQPLLDIHLNTDIPQGIAPVSDPQYALILAAIALLILIVGSINFVSLAISRSISRSKEVGVRKVVGAKRQQLIMQFLSEAVIITFIALLIGVVVAYLSLPLFNDLSEKSLVLQPDLFNGLTMLGLILIIGVMAGSYPAMVVSAFKPVSILKGKISVGGGNKGLRRVLVGVQFVLSVFLISCTLIMREQLTFLQSKNLGYDKEQLVVLQLNVPREGKMTDRISSAFEKGEIFQNELAKYPEVVSTGMASHTFGSEGWTNVGYTDDNDKYRQFNMNVVGADYIPTMQMQMAAGRNFERDNLADTRSAVIVNEAFVREYGWENPLGQSIPGKNFPDHEIVGVVQDFNYASLHGEIQPAVLVMDPKIIFQGIENISISSSPIPKIFIRIEKNKIAAALPTIETVWNQLAQEEEFQYNFVDQALAAQYEQEQNLGKIVSIAALLAIAIGSMGLFALASLNMENRTREISIRKVLGASERTLLMLLSKEYLLLVIIALLVAVPFTWFFMNDWLSTFAYKINIGAGIFLLTGVIALMITLLTTSFHAVKTARKQPANTLKCE